MRPSAVRRVCSYGASDTPATTVPSRPAAADDWDCVQPCIRRGDVVQSSRARARGSRRPRCRRGGARLPRALWCRGTPTPGCPERPGRAPHRARSDRGRRAATASSAEARACSDVVGVAVEAVAEHEVEAGRQSREHEPDRERARTRAVGRAVPTCLAHLSRYPRPWTVLIAGAAWQRRGACAGCVRCTRRACCPGRSRRAATPCGSAPGARRLGRAPGERARAGGTRSASAPRSELGARDRVLRRVEDQRAVRGCGPGSGAARRSSACSRATTSSMSNGLVT